jgi:hypothetical protein
MSVCGSGTSSAWDRCDFGIRPLSAASAVSSTWSGTIVTRKIVGPAPDGSGYPSAEPIERPRRLRRFASSSVRSSSSS